MSATIPKSITQPKNVVSQNSSRRVTNDHVDLSGISSRARILHDIQSFVDEQLVWLKPVKDSWQPTDFLPDFGSKTWTDEIRRLHARAHQLSDELLVVLVGDLITEEALPTYQTLLNRAEGLADRTGVSDSPWARWTRGWTAEENRHGELLSKYLYLSGRVNGRAVDATTQHLIRNGFDPKTDGDPYRSLIYTAFQERATRISHGNTAQLAAKSGDSILAKICQTIAGDEARHEEAYKRFVRRIFEIDPNGAIDAFAQMLKGRIAMPGQLMSDGSARDVFSHFSAVAQRIGVYTIRDYAGIVEHLVTYWGIADMKGFSGHAAAAQDYVSGLADVYRRAADRIDAQLRAQTQLPCSWVFNRPV